MKTYYETENGALETNGSYIQQGHRFYLQAEQEVADGEAEIIPFDPAAAEAEQERATQLAEAHQYLATTDWYVIRQMDSGVMMPDEIKQERQACRKLINTIGDV